MEALRTKTASFPAKILKDYRDRLDVSWIFHDNALEGVVLSFAELKAAIDQRIISDVTLIPMYEEVRNHKTAVDFVREASVAKKPPAVDLDLVRKLYALLTPEEAAKGYPYRRENPLHRLYYHEIAAPEKITYRMRKLGEWMESDEFADLHPITRAVKAHFRVLSVYPWTKNSGKVARLLMNFILIKHGYLPGGHPFDRAPALLRGAALRERRPDEPGRRVAREQHRDDRQIPGRDQRPARQARQLDLRQQ